MSHSYNKAQTLVWVLGIISLGTFALYYSISQPNKVEKPSAITANPIKITAELDRGITHAEYTLFGLPAGLDKAQIHDILFHSGAMWIGTDTGLVKILGTQVSLYKQFRDWPFEWIKNLVATPHGIVVQTHVAMGNTGGGSSWELPV